MALQFLSDADVGDAELVINLDLEGLQALLTALTNAVERRKEQLALEGAETGEAAVTEARNEFGRVTVRYLDGELSGERPATDKAGGARGSGETACWELPRR